MLADPPAARIALLLDLVLAGAPATPRPSAPVLLAWGADDRLPGTGAGAARKLERALDARLALIAAAGHCPQVEQPDAFAAAITAFAA